MRHRTPLLLLVPLALALLGLWLAGRTGPGEARDREPGAAATGRSGSDPGSEALSGRVSAERVGAERAGASTAGGDAPSVARPDPRRSVLQGTLRDARTGEPVPDFLLGLTDGRSANDHVRTDGEGRFATRSAFDPGRLFVSLLDTDEARLRYGRVPVEVEDPRQPLELTVEVGPTYRFRFPQGTGPRAEGYRVVSARSDGPPPTRRDLIHAQVRSGPLPWVRMHPDDVAYGGTGPGVLWLVDEQGNWLGRTTSDVLVGVDPEPRSVTVHPCGRLQGIAWIAEDGLRVPPNGGHVRLTDPEGREAWTAMDQGDFAFELLRPGVHTLEVQHPLLQPLVRDVAVRAGERTQLDLELVRRPMVGGVRGTLVERGGRLGLVGRVVAEQGGVVHATSVRTGETFELGPFPAGEVRVSVDPASGEVRPAGEPLTVQVPAADLELACAPRDEGQRLDLWARDADGRPRDLELVLRGEDVDQLQVWTGRQRVIVYGLQPGQRVHWYAHVAGCRLERGELADARTDANGVLEWVARPEVGWGVVLKAWDVADGRPVPGVQLALDGVPCAPTDAQGEVGVSAARAPSGLSVVSPEWVLVPSPDVGAEGVPLRDGRWAGVAVYLRRAGTDAEH